MSQKRGFKPILTDKNGCSTILMVNIAPTKRRNEKDQKTISIKGLVKIASTPQDEYTAERMEASSSTKLLHLTHSGNLKGLDLAKAMARLRVAIA